MVDQTAATGELANNSKSDTYQINILDNQTGDAIAETLELVAGKSVSSITLTDALSYGNHDCTVVITAVRDGKTIGTLEVETTIHVAYLWPEEVLA